MSNDKPYYHGRDHRPGGTDPATPGPRHYIGDSGEPAFQNSWVNIGGDSVPMHFLIVIGRPNDLNEDGTEIVQYQHKVLEIAGETTGRADGTVVFTLPLAYRFEEDRPYPSHDDAGVYVPCRLYVNGEFVRGAP